MTETALAGVKVLEYARLVAGPYCTKLVADMGAEVIKIEPPNGGDEARRREPFLKDVPHPERSGLFFYLNTNKMGITLNLNTTTGREMFKELVKDADVLVEDHPPQAMAELGLDYESLKDINPRLIMVSITPFGQTGPYREYKAYHLNTYHGSGLAKILSDILPDEIKQPLNGAGYLGEYDSGLSAAVALMGALYGRLFTGMGQHIDISKQESLIALERVEIGMYGNEGFSMMSTVAIQNMLGGLRYCKDGHVMLVIPMEHQWRALIELMGNPDWAQDERYKDEFSRAQHAQVLNDYITEWMSSYTKDEIFHRAQALSCPIGAVNTSEDLLASDQLKAMESFL
jgi:crotonobetainyl-CoA:carnitine CoA-transferase CaiB-like acyl-CoA transferase